LAQLGLCKSQCAGACASCSKRGECGSQQSAETGSDHIGSGQSGSLAGSAPGGNPLNGSETNLDSLREQKEVTGIRGEGSSEVETELSAEQTETAKKRLNAETYQEFRKQTESVLDSEPIPFGQRQVIRRYFESIRPESENVREN
jgi:hypothetical protein